MNYEQRNRKKRQRWKRQQDQRCMMCRQHSSSLDVHEIIRRSEATRQWAKACNYLILCRTCHDGIHRNNTPIVSQLAVKLLADPECFNLDTINRISHRPRVTMAEVIRHIKRKYRI